MNHDVHQQQKNLLNFIKEINNIFSFNTDLEFFVSDWLILEATTFSKISFHAILDHDKARFRCTKAISNTLRFILNFLKNDDKWLVDSSRGPISPVDLNVYGKNQNFRLLLSKKLNKNNPFTLSDVDERHLFKLFNTQIPEEQLKDGKILSFNNTCEILGMSLIASEVDSGVKCKFIEDYFGLGNFQHIKQSKFSEIQNRTKLDGNKEFLSLVMTLIDGNKMGLEIDKIDLKFGNQIFIQTKPTLSCPFIGRQHKSNKTYLHFNLVKNNWSKLCQDPDCFNRIRTFHPLVENEIVIANSILNE